MNTKTPVNTQLRFFLKLLLAPAFMAIIAPITAIAVPDNLFVSANQGGSIFEYTPAGIQSTFASYPTKLPRGLAFDSNGNLFAAVKNSTGSGGSLNKFTSSGPQDKFGGACRFPSRLALGSPGNYVAIAENPGSS